LRAPVVGSEAGVQPPLGWPLPAAPPVADPPVPLLPPLPAVPPTRWYRQSPLRRCRCCRRSRLLRLHCSHQWPCCRLRRC